MIRRQTLVKMVILLAPVLAFHCIRTYQENLQQPTDFKIFLQASRVLYAGGNPYQPAPNLLPYVYPLTLTCFFGPLDPLPILPAATVFTVLSFAAWLTLAVLCTRQMRRDASPPLILYVLPSLVAYRFVLRCCLHGQIDQILILIIAGGLALLSAGRRRSGLALLALGFAIKPLFGILLVYPGFVLGAGAWIEAGVWSAFWMGLPALVTGPARLVTLYASWLTNQGAHELVDPAFDVGSANQCLYATMYRWLDGRDPRMIDVFPSLGLVHSARPIIALWAVLATFILGLTLWMLVRRRVDPLSAGPALILATHLVFKKTWEYHLVTLVFVFTFLLARYLRAGNCLRARWLRAALCTAAMLINFYSPLFVGKHASLVLQGYGPTTLALVILWLASLLEACAERISEEEEAHSR